MKYLSIVILFFIVSCAGYHKNCKTHYTQVVGGGHFHWFLPPATTTTPGIPIVVADTTKLTTTVSRIYADTIPSFDTANFERYRVEGGNMEKWIDTNDIIDTFPLRIIYRVMCLVSHFDEEGNLMEPCIDTGTGWIPSKKISIKKEDLLYAVKNLGTRTTPELGILFDTITYEYILVPDGGSAGQIIRRNQTIITYRKECRTANH